MPDNASCRQRQGVTLLELIVALVIVVLIAVVVVPTIPKRRPAHRIVSVGVVQPTGRVLRTPELRP